MTGTMVVKGSNDHYYGLSVKGSALCNTKSWLIAIRMLTTARYHVIGPADDLRRWAKQAGLKFLRVVRAYQRCY